MISSRGGINLDEGDEDDGDDEDDEHDEDDGDLRAGDQGGRWAEER